MAFDITANDLRVISKTEMISNSRFPTEVWKGTCTFKGRQAVVAIKIIRQLIIPDNEPSLARLQREVRTLYTCKHPNLVRFIGVSYEYDGEQGMHAPCDNSVLQERVYHGVPGKNRK